MHLVRLSPSAHVVVASAALTAFTGLLLFRNGPSFAFAFALLPMLLFAAALLVGEGRFALYVAVFALPLTGITAISQTLAFGGVVIQIPDILILLALGSWAFGTLLARARGIPGPRVPASAVLGWPLVAFAALIVIPLLRGHYAYGASIIGQPLRLFAYAAIVMPLAGVTPQRLYRTLLWVFYTGMVVTMGWATYYVATGRSQSASNGLSTGGIRPLAISSSLYCAGALFLALLTIRKSPGRAGNAIHFAMAVLGLIGVVLGFGRGVFAAVALVLLVLLLTSRGVRRGVFLGLPLALPFLCLLALVVVHTAPNLVSSAQHRISSPPGQDPNVLWREHANAAVLEQVRERPIVGVGFGRHSTFYFDVKNSAGFLVPFRQDIEQDPHNGYVYLLAGGGVLALGAFLAIVCVFAVDAVRRYRGSPDDVERLLILWAAATLFCFLFEAASGTMFEDTIDLLAIWALLVVPGIVPLRRRMPRRLGGARPVAAR